MGLSFYRLLRFEAEALSHAEDVEYELYDLRLSQNRSINSIGTATQ